MNPSKPAIASYLSGGVLGAILFSSQAFADPCVLQQDLATNEWVSNLSQLTENFESSLSNSSPEATHIQNQCEETQNEIFRKLMEGFNALEARLDDLVKLMPVSDRDRLIQIQDESLRRRVNGERDPFDETQEWKGLWEKFLAMPTVQAKIAEIDKAFLPLSKSPLHFSMAEGNWNRGNWSRESTQKREGLVISMPIEPGFSPELGEAELFLQLSVEHFRYGSLKPLVKFRRKGSSTTEFIDPRDYVLDITDEYCGQISTSLSFPTGRTELPWVER